MLVTGAFADCPCPHHKAPAVHKMYPSAIVYRVHRDTVIVRDTVETKEKYTSGKTLVYFLGGVALGAVVGHLIKKEKTITDFIVTPCPTCGDKHKKGCK